MIILVLLCCTCFSLYIGDDAVPGRSIMGLIYKVEGKTINILEGDIVKIILQLGVSSVVESLTKFGGIVTTGVQPAEKNF